MARKNVLITGINGFVGSNLALSQLAAGNHVIGIIRDKNHKTRPDVLSKCSIVEGTITDPKLVDHAVSNYEADVVFHLAANAIVRIGVKDPASNYMTNVMGTVNVLDAVRRTRPTAKVVVASSYKSYGEQAQLPYTEDMKLVPEDPYSTSKACTDMIAQSYAKTYDMNVNVVRCSNIYGPGDMNTSRLIPNSILRILRGEKPEIYSGVRNFRREFIYIDDVCDAYNLMVTSGKPGHIYNIGINKFHTIEETVALISEAAGSSGYDIIDRDFPEIPFQWMDGSKLKALGWDAKVSFRDGIERCFSWYKQEHLRQLAVQEDAKASS